MDKLNRIGRVEISFFLCGLMVVCWLFIVPRVLARTYDFDEGLDAVTEGLVSENSGILKNKKVAVFGIIESKSGKKWLISSHIEDGIVDALVNNGCRVIERRRIQDVIKREIKETTDLWFDQDQVAQFGKLVGADIVVTGSYVLWGQGMVKISIRAINVADGEIVAADKVKIFTDRIASLLKSEEDGKHPKEPDVSLGKSVVEPSREESKATLAVNTNVTDAKVLYEGIWTRSENGKIVDVLKLNRVGFEYTATFHTSMDGPAYSTAAGSSNQNILILTSKTARNTKVVIKATVEKNTLRYSSYNEDGSSRFTGEFSRVIPPDQMIFKNVFSGVQAAYVDVRHYQTPQLYLFKDTHYERYDLFASMSIGLNKITKGYPGIAFETIDAAYVDARNSESPQLYLFSGVRYCRYDIRANKMVGVNTIKNGYPGLPFKTIDAAYVDSRNLGKPKLYLFSGSRYARYDILNDRYEGSNDIAKGYPGVTFKFIDAAYVDVSKPEGPQLYLFSGSNYARYDIRTDRIIEINTN